MAQKFIPEQAYHFKEMVKEALSEHLKEKKTPGILTAPYDAELFGHWWFEGPEWLYHVIKNFAEDGEVDLVTGGEYVSARKKASWSRSRRVHGARAGSITYG